MYSYLFHSPLLSQIQFTNGTSLRMTTTKIYDYLNRLTAISSANAFSTVLDSHNYNYNPANQRTTMTNADGTYWKYQYDSLGQVISGIKYWSDGSVVAGQQFGYGFDDIGNRTQTSAGGDQWGANLRYASYTANDLNQYTSRTVPPAVDIIGTATNTATVTVNNCASYRKGNYYRVQLPMTNSLSAVYQTVTNLAVLNVGTSFAVQTNIIGSEYLSKTPESFTHDLDGNLTSDGHWLYTWDAENRLVGMTNNNPVGPQMGLAFVYDSKSRRIGKTVTTTISTNALEFLYDGWNLIDEMSSNSIVRSYLWGGDLSGSMQGAGGVGGLLKMSYGTINCFPSYDGNGNVTGLESVANGTILAAYEYGPFGKVIRASGPMARVNPIRFSTKCQDDESDLVYYGYRYYNASTGRWLTEDPLNEAGFELVSKRQRNVAKKTLADIQTILSAIWDRDPALAKTVEETLLKNGLNMQELNQVVEAQNISSIDQIDEEEGKNIYAFVANNSINTIDPSGLLKVYGNWCGPDWTGGRVEEYNFQRPPGYYKAPIDTLDAACQTHDICYAKCRKNFPCNPKQRSQCFRTCDNALTKAAYAVGGFWGNVIGKGIDRPGGRDPGPNAYWCCWRLGNRPGDW